MIYSDPAFHVSFISKEFFLIESLGSYHRVRTVGFNYLNKYGFGYKDRCTLKHNN